MRRRSTKRDTDWSSATAITSAGLVVTAAGAVPVRAPRVNDKRSDAETGERHRVSSAMLLPGARFEKGNPSNDPTNQEAISESRDSRSTSLDDYSSAAEQ
jgi:hypothetical protein